MMLAIPWQTVGPRLEAVLDRPIDHLPPELHQNHADATLEPTMHAVALSSTRADRETASRPRRLVNVLPGWLLLAGWRRFPIPSAVRSRHPRDSPP